MGDLIFSSSETADALAKRCRELDRARRLDELRDLLAAERAARPNDAAVLAEGVRLARRLGDRAAALAVISEIEPAFPMAGARLQAFLIAEAEQLQDWPLFRRLAAAAAASKDAGAFMLAAMARVAFQDGNRALAAALYEADERTNWARRYVGRKVLVTFPKSGTTWLRFALAEYVRLGAGLGEAGHTVDVNEMLARASRPADFVSTHDIAMLADESGDWADEDRLFVERQRLRYDRSRVIFLVRDPRDVAVSYYHQLTKRNAAPRDLGSIDDFVAHRIRGIPRVLRFYELIEPLTARANVLTLYYEDLLGDMAGNLARVVAFLGYGDVGSAEHIVQAAQASSFSAMKGLESADIVSGLQTLGGESRDHMKVRRGMAGGFADEVSASSVASALKAAGRRRPKHLLARYGL